MQDTTRPVDRKRRYPSRDDRPSLPLRVKSAGNLLLRRFRQHADIVVAPPPLVGLLRQGHPIEAGWFADSVMGDKAHAPLRPIADDDGAPFIYPVVNAYTGALGRTDKTYGYLEDLPPPVLHALRSGRGLLVLDHSHEGGRAVSQHLAALHGRLALMEIDPRRVMFLTQNVRYEEGYRNWHRALGDGAPEPIAVATYNFSIRQFANFVSDHLIPSLRFAQRRASYLQSIARGRERSRHFVCLNYAPRYHRLATMLTLMHLNLEDRGYISFPGFTTAKYSIAGRAESLLDRAPFPDLDALKALLPTLATQPPRILDTQPMDDTPVLDIGSWWYYIDSWFSLITESGVVGAGHERVTEKPFKPILGLHPFLIVGLPRTLRILRDHGFRTFASVFDESYDEIDDDGARMAAVIAELRRLCAIAPGDWPTIGQTLRENVLHNFDHFTGPLQRHLRERVEAPLIERMAILAAHDTLARQLRS